MPYFGGAFFSAGSQVGLNANFMVSGLFLSVDSGLWTVERGAFRAAHRTLGARSEKLRVKCAFRAAHRTPVEPRRLSRSRTERKPRRLSRRAPNSSQSTVHCSLFTVHLNSTWRLLSVIGLRRMPVAPSASAWLRASTSAVTRYTGRCESFSSARMAFTRA